MLLTNTIWSPKISKPRDKSLKCLNSSAVEAPVKYQGDRMILTPILVASRLNEICWWDALPLSDERPRITLAPYDTPEWISNHMLNKVKDEITYPFPKYPE